MKKCRCATLIPVLQFRLIRAQIGHRGTGALVDLHEGHPMSDTQTVANAPSIHEQEWAGLLARIAVGDQSALAELYDVSSARSSAWR